MMVTCCQPGDGGVRATKSATPSNDSPLDSLVQLAVQVTSLSTISTTGDSLLRDTAALVFRQSVDLLRHHRADLRIRQLDLFTTKKWFQHITFKHFDLPSLESASLNFWENGELQRRIQQTAKGIHTLQLRYHPQDKLDWGISNLPYLRDLTLWGSPWVNYKSRELQSILGGASHLVLLRLMSISISGDEHLSIPTLQSLRLVSTQVDCELVSPRLHNIAMGLDSTFATGEPMDLTSLEILTLEDCRLAENLHIRAASLYALTIQLSLANSGATMHELRNLLDRQTGAGFISLRVLHLRVMFVHSIQLSQLLGQLSSLWDLELSGFPLKKPFFEALTGSPLPNRSSNSDRGGTPICASLRLFDICLEGILQTPTRKAMTKSARMAVHERGKGKFPLTIAQIRTRKLDPWTSSLE
ncbi:hypothetical protein FRC17_001704 [Serendipita sp. 399]|nr:hypothetical protein FRC17_001704 [Serendipita sp. 399]